MPKISGQECVQLQEAAEHIRQSIKVGEAYISGEVANLRDMVIKMEKPCDLIQVKEPDVDELKEQESEAAAKTDKIFEKEPPKAGSLYSR